MNIPLLCHFMCDGMLDNAVKCRHVRCVRCAGCLT